LQVLDVERLRNYPLAERRGALAIYDFERCSVYLLEDNSYIRKVVESLLHGIKFGRVSSAPDGAEAIEFFRALQAGARLGGGPAFDVVISDLVMAPINGLLFLRWLRTAKGSPNRFIPFIMLSGAADAKHVNAARDLGVTEFLSKPFSVTPVYKKILEVIDCPRQFVATQSYFGPDRRR
jgi:CheY-like chemotaxis protein